MEAARVLTEPHASPRAIHDLSRFDRRRRVREAVAATAPTAKVLPHNNVRAQIEARRRAREISLFRLRYSLTALLGFAIVFSVMLAIVFGYVQLSDLSREANRIQTEMNLLTKECETLMTEGEALVNMEEVNRIAVEELGMVRPDPSQIVYVDLSGENHAVIIEKEHPAQGFLHSVWSLLSPVVEYFR